MLLMICQSFTENHPENLMIKKKQVFEKNFKLNEMSYNNYNISTNRSILKLVPVLN